MEQLSLQPLASCPDGSLPQALPQSRKMCPTTSNPDGCLVYSFGSNNDFGFEEAVLRQDARCKIHTFDPTTTRVHGAGSTNSAVRGLSLGLREALSVHMGAGLAHFNGAGDIPTPRNARPQVFPMKTLPALMNELGHHHVDILKIDTSGELEVLYTLNASNASSALLDSFDQVLMEVGRPLPCPTTLACVEKFTSS